MKPIYHLLLNYSKKHYNTKALLSILLLLAICISINYSIELEDDYIDQIQHDGWRFLAMFFFQGLPYLLTIWILQTFGLVGKWWEFKGFWFTFIIGFSLLALDRSVYFADEVSRHITPLNYRYNFKIVNFLSGLVFIIIPLLVFGWITQKDNKSFGLFSRFTGIKPYLILLAFGILCVFIGGFFGDIQDYYPIYNKANPIFHQQKTGLNNFESIALFETSYALSFISVEVFFRGFLIFAFSRYLGTYVVFPMAVTYCVLHFGKPMTETISSIFGGYILGIVALKHKNIRGGILIHVGMALSMEIIGYLHRII